jgi:hypothetical protein
MSGMSRMSRHAVSGTVYLSHDPVRKKKTICDQRCCGVIMKLPPDHQQRSEWQAATEALILAEDRGPLMHARVRMLRALNRNVKRVFNPDHKEPHWGRRKRMTALAALLS